MKRGSIMGHHTAAAIGLAAMAIAAERESEPDEATPKQSDEETFSQKFDRISEEKRLEKLPKRENYPSRQAYRQALREHESYYPDKWKTPDPLSQEFREKRYKDRKRY